ncbi:MAG: hypothetical protein R3229_14735 [Alphaproteobacteria bacterium]|nr:hypothetical protein [Alphaproteobacteria bacterium]
MGAIRFLVLAALLALGTQAASADPFRVNSGKVLDIRSIKAEDAAAGRTLVMTYAGNTPLSDRLALRKEADELWEHFVVNVEAGGYKRAVIRARGPERGKPVDFIFVKRGAAWRTLENGLGPKGRLNEAFVRGFLDRLREPLRTGSDNAAMLYMGRDWRGTLSDPKFGAYPAKSFDRASYLRQAAAGRAQVADYSQTYEVLGIEVSPDGTAARTETRQTGRMTVHGQRLTIVTRSIDHFELRGGAMVWIRSQGSIEDRRVGR